MDINVFHYTSKGSTRRKIKVNDLRIDLAVLFQEEPDIEYVSIKYADDEHTKITYRKAPHATEFRAESKKAS